MDVFDLCAKISVDTDEYEKGLNNASNASSTFSSVAKGVGATAAGIATTIAAVGAAAVGAGKALYNSIAETAALGDEIDKGSQKLGISAELYQKLGYAADLSGASIENLKKGVTNITDALAEFASGGAEAEEAYTALGVSFTNTDGSIKDSETVLTETLLALSDMSDITARNAAANDIFGKSYQELLPLLNSGSEGIAAMMQEAEDYGMVMSDETVKASAGFQDALTQLSGTFDGLKNNLLSDFLPSITLVMDGFSDLLSDNEGGTEKLVSGFTKAVNNIKTLIPKVMTVLKGIIPAVAEVAPDLIKNLAMGIIDALPELSETALTLIEDLADMILESLPHILEVGISIANTLVTGIGEMLPTLIPNVISTIIDLFLTLINNAQGILDASMALISGFVDGIIKAIPIVIKALPDLILGIINFILSAIPQIIDCGITLFMSLIDALPEIIDAICEALPQIIEGIITALLNAIPQLIAAGISLFVAIIAAMPQIIVEIVKAIPQIIKSVISALKNSWPQIKESGRSLFSQIISGLVNNTNMANIGTKMYEIISSIGRGLSNGFSYIKNIGVYLMQGLLSGINSMVSSIWDTITNLASGITNTFKSILGIASPSKVFKQFGKFIDEGLAIGIEDNTDLVDSSISDLEDSVSAFDPSVSTEIGVGSSTSDGIIALLKEYLPSIANTQIVMDTGAIVGQIAPSMDAALGSRMIQAARSV